MRDWSTTQAKAFKGNFQPLKISWCRPRTSEPITVGFSIDWTQYGAGTATQTVAVDVDLNNPAPGGPALDQINAVYIDNTGSSTPIYVYFPDTGYVITQQPFSSSWQVVFTNGTKAKLIGQGFVNNQIVPTRFMFTNINVPSFIDNEIAAVTPIYKASPVNNLSASFFTTNLGIPALGDTTFPTVLGLGAGGSAAAFTGNPAPTVGFYYLTGLHLYLSDTKALVGAGQTQGTLSLGFNGPPFFSIFNWRFAWAEVDMQGGYRIADYDAMQLKLDATKNWVLQYTPGLNVFFKGTANLDLIFTYNPT